MDTSSELQAPEKHVPQDLSWTAQKSKEDVLTFSFLEAVTKAFRGAGATLVPELDHGRRLKQDFVLTLPTGQRLTIEAKFEDYPHSLFPEVAQLVVRPGNVRRIEPGWVYKTTAQYLLYISPVSGLATLIPRARVLELQVLLLQDVLLGSAKYDVPVMLNAALNAGARGDAIPMPRAGIGLGLLRNNILKAYQCHYDNAGLYQFDLSDSLMALKQHFTGAQAIPGGPRATTALTQWAHDKLMTEPHGESSGLVTLEELPSRLAASPLVVNDQLSRTPIAPNCYKFFVNAVGAQMNSGQAWLFPHVAGTYQVSEGVGLDVKTPLSSKSSTRHQGRALTRGQVHARTEEHLSRLKLPVENLNAKRLAYLGKLESRTEAPV